MPSADHTPILVAGAGAWGTALAVLLARNGSRTLLWSHEANHVAEMARLRANPAFLPGIAFPDLIEPVADLSAAAVPGTDCLVAVPSVGFRATLRQLAGHAPAEGLRLAWATKGFDPGSGALLHEVAREELPAAAVAVVSGPTFALEVARGLPTAVTVASGDPAFAGALGGRLGNGHFRVYTSEDIIGVSVGGAVKNVLAIATGIADGLGLGANTRAALITRGLAEITRLGVALGGRRETFTGLTGLGDLVLTCTDDQSRNRRMGLALGRGMEMKAALAAIDQVVEGVETVREVHSISRRHGVDMPISAEVYAVIHEGKPPQEAAKALLSREPRAEDVA